MAWIVQDVKKSGCFDVAVCYVCPCGQDHVVPMRIGNSIPTMNTCDQCGLQLVLAVPYADGDKLGWSARGEIGPVVHINGPEIGAEMARKLSECLGLAARLQQHRRY